MAMTALGRGPLLGGCPALGRLVTLGGRLGLAAVAGRLGAAARRCQHLLDDVDHTLHVTKGEVERRGCTSVFDKA